MERRRTSGGAGRERGVGGVRLGNVASVVLRPAASGAVGAARTDGGRLHVVEHVEQRMAAPREPGFEGRFAGRELRRPGMERELGDRLCAPNSGPRPAYTRRAPASAVRCLPSKRSHPCARISPVPVMGHGPVTLGSTGGCRSSSSCAS